MKPNKIYIKYQREDNTTFLSVIEPQEWTVDTQPYKYIGMFKLNSDGIWKDVTKTGFEHDGDWRNWGQQKLNEQ